jgi:hypothetical protein
MLELDELHRPAALIGARLRFGAQQLVDLVAPTPTVIPIEAVTGRTPFNSTKCVRLAPFRRRCETGSPHHCTVDDILNVLAVVFPELPRRRGAYDDDETLFRIAKELRPTGAVPRELTWVARH